MRIRRYHLPKQSQNFFFRISCLKNQIHRQIQDQVSSVPAQKIANLREGAAKEGWGEECAAPERVKSQNKRRLRWRAEAALPYQFSSKYFRAMARISHHEKPTLTGGFLVKLDKLATYT
ncbi:MAG: hypothetical protein UX60_C0011G0023 [Berkelbacteria bacterium GW2011_GWA2_46_7]|uniref:Uncharacterized protein n=1 Tax=Berkelbacteria bacterium GW2011_GWA2_46_7 TaxID=1618335 RepID=A0A0G1SQ26_9BACT|nr:MAG: hypothetical protein UX60_C0011G0023 [Berkelbacteria bacterium GW2011_GWA2_46_7]